MKETRFAPQAEAVPEPNRASRGGFDKLRRYVAPEEAKEQQKKSKNEEWREQE